MAEVEWVAAGRVVARAAVAMVVAEGAAMKVEVAMAEVEWAAAAKVAAALPVARTAAVVTGPGRFRNFPRCRQCRHRRASDASEGSP